MRLFHVYYVGMRGFEPPASSSRTKRATWLRYIPIVNEMQIYKYFRKSYIKYSNILIELSIFLLRRKLIVFFNLYLPDMIRMERYKVEIQSCYCGRNLNVSSLFLCTLWRLLNAKFEICAIY